MAQEGTWNVTVNAAIAAGDNNIGNVDIVTLPGVGATGAAPPASAAYMGAYTSAATMVGVHLGYNGANSGGNTHLGVVLMGQYDDVSPTVPGENSFSNLRMTSRRELFATLRDAAGNERGLNIGASGDASVTVVSALPAGTNAIGKLAANSGVDIGDVDVLSLPALAAGTNAIGALVPADKDVTGHTNYARKYYTSAGAVTDGIIWSPAVGKRWHLTSLFVQVSAAATVTIEDDKVGGDDPVLKAELAANSGIALSWDSLYPFASGEDAADLIITTSAGNVYVSAVGYEI